MAQSPPAVRTGAHSLLEALEARGARYLFGVPGHGAYPIYNAIVDVPALTPVVGRHEQSSLFSAIGYAWAGGGVAVATSVPEAGLTNAATGLLEATWAQARLLYLLEENVIHRDILRPIARYYRRSDSPEGLVADIHALYTALETGRPGAAALEIPTAVLTAAVEGGAVTGRPEPPAPTMPPPAELDRAIDALRAAGRVVILAGASAAAAEAGAVVRRLAEALAAPVAVDGFAKGLLPESHPLALGRHWTPTGPVEELLDEADLLLVIGAPQAGGQGAASWSPRMVAGPAGAERRLLLVDWDDLEHGDLPAVARLYGHLPSILAALADGVAGRPPAEGFPAERLEECRTALWRYADERVPWAVPFFEGLRATLPSDAILLLDSLVGLWLDRLLPAERQNSTRFPYGTGTLGFGVPAAVGAKLAQPEREVVVVAGDGAFLYNPQELATMRLYGQKVTVIVANDDCYAAIKHNMQENFGRATAYGLANPDFVAFGQAFGMRARRLETAGEIGTALGEALAGESATLIEAPLELRPPRRFYS